MTHHAIGRAPRVWIAIVMAGAAIGGGLSVMAQAQAPPSLLTIPYLANKTKPADLDFLAAQCDRAPTGDRMTCRFRQVFLTLSSIDAASCVITTNGYEQMFRRETPARWVSESDPDGECGVVETTTLEDGGGPRWTMTVRTVATRRSDQPACRATAREPEVYDWLSVKRALPCTSIQPGAIER